MELSDYFVTKLLDLAKVGISMLLGALIGVEREAAEKSAGLRTHMLVRVELSLRPWE